MKFNALRERERERERENKVRGVWHLVLVWGTLYEKGSRLCTIRVCHVEQVMQLQWVNSFTNVISTIEITFY